MASEAQIKASTKFNRTRDSITIRPDKKTGEMIRTEAKKRGMSNTEFILAAINKYVSLS